MTLNDYLLDIARTDDVELLGGLSSNAFADLDLDASEYVKVNHAAFERLAVLQRVAGKESK